MTDRVGGASIAESGAVRPQSRAQDWRARFSAYGSRLAPSEIQELMKLLESPDVISLAGGVPDARLFLSAEIERAHSRILGNAELAQVALQYTHSEGLPALRDWLAEKWRRKGLQCGPENILITSGGQQALDLVARLFLSEGDALVTAPTIYPGALCAFGPLVPAYLPLADLLEGRSIRAKMAYAVPDFANPTGESLTQDQRASLVEAARRSSIVLVEDSPYTELSYDRPIPPSLLELSAAMSGSVEDGCVVHCGTISKSVAPGLRVGWIIAPSVVIRQLVLLKQSSDLFTNPLSQMVVLEIAASAGSGYLEKVRNAYRLRRDGMLAALDSHMPSGTTWSRPGGGMFVWLTLPAEIDASALLRAAVRECGVAFVPGSAFFPGEPRRNTARLSFCLNDVERNDLAIERLAKLVRCWR